MRRAGSVGDRYSRRLRAGGRLAAPGARTLQGRGVVTRRVAVMPRSIRPVAAGRAGAVGGGTRRRRRAMGSRELGIDLASGRPAELFKWFLACLLFGKPIQQEVAAHTYREFAQAWLLTPRAILEAGWDRLVEVLGRGHYVRFDFSMTWDVVTTHPEATIAHAAAAMFQGCLGGERAGTGCQSAS
jgi:hypothetical protein